MKNPFLFDSETIEEIAGHNAITQGITYFKENRVMGIDYNSNSLWAMVEDEDFDFPVDVSVNLDNDNRLFFTCSCGLNGQKDICHHVVAALYAFADENGDAKRIMTAADTATQDRIKRGRAEVKVEPLSDSRCFGDWHAWSIKSTTHFPMKYTVTIRSLQRKANFCTCPDFACNQLTTCKHIEAVLYKISKHKEYEKFKNDLPPFCSIYMFWDENSSPVIKLYNRMTVQGEMRNFVDEYFNKQEVFTGRLPDDFFRFSEMVEGRSDIHVSEDVKQYVHHKASIAARRIYVEKIMRQLSDSRGRISGIKARLYPYQMEGVAFLAGTGRALLADDMGLGKTLQAIAASVWLQQHEGVKTVLIVTPASLKHQWAGEIKRFTETECQLVQGSPETRGIQYRRDCRFFVLNYELLLRDFTLINETLRPDLIILDEAQRIKNWRTKIASAVKLVTSRFAFVLTGTPLENRLEDLFSLMQVVDPNVLGPLWRYMVDFHITDEKGKVMGYRNLSILRRKIAPVMLRRDRKLVSDQLPDRIVKRLDVGMTPAQDELHSSAMCAAGSIANIAKKRPLTPSEQNRLMSALQQARMACDAAGLVDKETEGSPKIDEMAAIIEEACIQSGLKAVVFSQWEMMTRMVEDKLREMGVGSVRLHGKIPTSKRGKLIDGFRNDDCLQVFISTDAGGVGLNLQNASVLINLDMPWNPAVLEQRNARIHRLGQKNKVQIINMVAKNSYEEHVLKLLSNKQDLFDNVIVGEGDKDVVGISKKLVETIVNDLTDTKGLKTSEIEEATSEVDKTTLPYEKKIMDRAPDILFKGAEEQAVEESLTLCIKELQKTFGPRIERITGMDGGLLVVVDRFDNEMDAMSERLSDTVSVAFIDRRTLNGLERLGAVSELTESKVLYNSLETVTPKVNTLSTLARKKLKAARILMDQQCVDGVADLLLSSMLAAASSRAGMDDSVSEQNAGVWLWSEAVPKGLIDQKDATLIMRGLTLAQSPSVPEPLLKELLEDVDDFVESLSETLY